MVGMIRAHYVERRTQILPGKKPETVVREVNVTGKKTRKHVRVYRGNKLVSNVNKPLTAVEKKNIQQHVFTPSLFTALNVKTLRKLNRTRKARAKKSDH
jgi:hypothetical protein